MYIPAPSDCNDVVDPDANTINLSSTTSSVVFNVTVLPCTVKSPITVRLVPFTDIADFNDDVYEFIELVDTFKAAILASALAESNSKLFNLLDADAVNVLIDPVLTFNALMLVCCEPELIFKFNTLTLTAAVYVFKFVNDAAVDALNVFKEPVLTLNALILACCEPELILRFNTLALTELV